MLVLIAGITGNLGQLLTKCLHDRGHAVRGMGRDRSKLSADILESLEGFVESTSYDDVPALNKACEGVDAVICAYSGTPVLHVEGQLLLLRAAERAGAKRFVAAAWNYDWRHLQLGQQESYDGLIMFHHQAKMTSSIKPIYIYTGVLAEVFFSAPGHVSFSPKNNGCWDSENKEVQVWGTGREIWHWTTEPDTAAFTVAILEREDAVEQQYWTVCSGAGTLPEIAEIYGRVRGCELSVKRMGTVEELRRKALEARAKGSPAKYWEYIGWFYKLYTVDGTWILRNIDNDVLDIQPTSLEAFLREKPKL